MTITFVTAFSFICGVMVTLGAVYYFVTKTVDKLGCFLFTGDDDVYMITKPKLSLEALVGKAEVEYSKDVLKSIDEYMKELIEKETKDKD